MQYSRAQTTLSYEGEEGVTRWRASGRLTQGQTNTNVLHICSNSCSFQKAIPSLGDRAL